MPDFSRVIRDAYLEILGRNPDAGGLRSYNQAMNAGLSEASLRESLLRSEEYRSRHEGFRPLVIHGGFNFEWRGYTSFGLFGRSLSQRIAWVQRGIAEDRTVFRAFSDTSFWPPDPLLDRVPKHRAVDSTGLHPSSSHLQRVRKTVLRAFSPASAVLEYVILVTQFEENGPLFRRFADTESYVLEVMEALNDLPNVVFELGNEVEAHGKGWNPARVDRMLAEIRSRWPQVIVSCSSGNEAQHGAYGEYIYPSASWANIHYPRRDFPELTFGWPRFSGPVVDDEPEFLPRTNVDAYLRHQELVRERGGFMTLHSEPGFVTDPDDESDLPALEALKQGVRSAG